MTIIHNGRRCVILYVTPAGWAAIADRYGRRYLVQVMG